MNCYRCGRELRDGDTAWASDWKVIDTSGERVGIRAEVRYLCDPCHESEDE